MHQTLEITIHIPALDRLVRVLERHFRLEAGAERATTELKQSGEVLAQAVEANQTEPQP